MEQNLKNGSKNLYLLFDKKSDSYILDPIVAVSYTDVLRMLVMSYKQNPKALYFQFPEDFQLHEVGQLSLEHGLITNTEDNMPIFTRYSFVDILIHCKTFDPVPSNEQA